MFMGPRHWFQGMNSASLCSLAGRYEKPYSSSVPSPHRLFKNSCSGYNGWLNRFLKRLQIRAQICPTENWIRSGSSVDILSDMLKCSCEFHGLFFSWKMYWNHAESHFYSSIIPILTFDDHQSCVFCPQTVHTEDQRARIINGSRQLNDWDHYGIRTYREKRHLVRRARSA